MDLNYLLNHLLPEPLIIEDKAPRLCSAVRVCVSNTASRTMTANYALIPDHLVTKTPTVSQKSRNCYLFLKLGEYVC
ncbi:MAG TPA: hypothetical protein DCE56_13475 [Cyanobacteria bacterium UBA8553]|nr:hypothetical protein [Cyanobacteria bacterium UBA8553]HAJ60815.1 hypothetical protein [Cyanobacteria bacterium UBA8543]